MKIKFEEEDEVSEANKNDLLNTIDPEFYLYSPESYRTTNKISIQAVVKLIIS